MSIQLTAIMKNCPLSENHLSFILMKMIQQAVAYSKFSTEIVQKYSCLLSIKHSIVTFRHKALFLKAIKGLIHSCLICLPVQKILWVLTQCQAVCCGRNHCFSNSNMPHLLTYIPIHRHSLVSMSKAPTLGLDCLNYNPGVTTV